MNSEVEIQGMHEITKSDKNCEFENDKRYLMYLIFSEQRANPLV